MLIGCCHCDRTKDPPSESLPPSSSNSNSSQSDSGSTPNYEYGTCDCIAVPVVWEVVWPAMDVNAACPITAGVYELSKTVYGPGCIWQTAELERRMRVVGGVWTCDSGTNPARALFTIRVDPTTLNVIQLLVKLSVFLPGGLGGGAYQVRTTNYATASGIECIHNGVLDTGGGAGEWPDLTDVIYPPYTHITMPLPATVTIRPKL